MNRVVVLLGAGASIDFGVPGTNRLTEIITERVTSDEWVRHQHGHAAFCKIATVLGEYLTNLGLVNYEQIYHCVHELQQLEIPRIGTVDEYRHLLVPFVANSS